MSATPILITVPKYVAISPSPMTRLLESPAPMDSSDCGRGKKRRLDHLTWEEKVQRKKLKNRVAAQTSRDRKKARMDEMESTIEVLKQQTEMLQNKCDSLHSINESLLEKNRKLDQQVEILQQQLEEIQKQRKDDEIALKSSCVGSKSSEKRSAVSISPLPKGLELESTQHDSKDSTASLWKIIALCLLYKTCSRISMPANSKSLPKVCSQISPQAWKTALQQAALMLPKVQANQSNCLDQWWGPQQSSWNPAKIPVIA